MKKEFKIFGIVFTAGFFVYPTLEQIFGFVMQVIILPVITPVIRIFNPAFVSHFPAGKSFVANVAIGVMGGVALYLIGKVNEVFEKLSKIQQYLIAYTIAVSIEWVSGIIINVLLGLDGWDYKWLPLSSPDGQINFFFSMIWFALMPFAFWLDDDVKKRYSV